MGRITSGSMRTRLQDSMKQLRGRYRAALKDDAFQQAFDEFWHSWSTEQAALIHSGLLSPWDLLLLQALVDSRREIITLRSRMEKLESNVLLVSSS